MRKNTLADFVLDTEPLDRQDRTGTARQFLETNYSHSDGATLIRTMHSNYVWKSTVGAFCELPPESLRSEVRRFLDERKVLTRIGENEVEQPYKPGMRDINEVLAAVEDLTVTEKRSPVWMDDKPGRPDPLNLVVCPNALVDVTTGQQYRPTPSLFATCAVPFDYDAAAPAPVQWLAFLTQIFEADRESIGALQEWFGYLLTADTSQQKMMLLVGPPRSGKGTVARILTAMLGAGNVASPTLAGLSTNFGLACLLDKHLALIGDARLSTKADQSIVLERLLSISGQDGITIDVKFKPSITTTLFVRMMMLTNELPRLNDPSGAVASRFVLLMLRNSFLGREDTGLTARLMTERPGILNWSIEGLRRLRIRGYFEQPKASGEAIDELAAAVSPTRTFVTDWCNVGPEHEVECSELYHAWCAWCDEQGKTTPGTIQTFSVDLRAALPSLNTRQRRIDGERERHYLGIGLRLQASESAAQWRSKRNGRHAT